MMVESGTGGNTSEHMDHSNAEEMNQRLTEDACGGICNSLAMAGRIYFRSLGN